VTVRSAGILLHRRAADGAVEVWLGHMGGPFWSRREASWSIPKGEHDDDEEPLDAALREFAEEIGVPAPAVEYTPLGAFRQRSGKVVEVFAAEWTGPLAWVSSTPFTLEWPPRSGRTAEFPEIDRARWWPVDAARAALVQGQRPVLDALIAHLGAG